MERRFRTHDWLMIGAAALMLIASVLPWWRVRVDATFDVSLDAYEFTMTGQVPVVALVVIAVLIVIIRTESLPLPLGLVHPYVLTPVMAAVAVLVGRRFLFSGFDDSGSVSRGIGVYLALVAVLVGLAGCVLAIRELRTPSGEASDDDLDDDDDLADQYGYEEQFEDDLTRRFNASLPTGDAPGRRSRDPGPADEPTRRRTTSAGEAASRRRAARPAAAPAPRARRRSRDAPPG